MKKFRSLITLIPFLALAISGCTKSPSTPKSSKKPAQTSASITDTSDTSSSSSSKTSKTSSGTYVPPTGTPSNPTTATNHITGITMKYTKDFFMQVGDELDFSVTFKGGGGEDEKGIKWTSSNPNVIKVVTNEEKTSQCVLYALKEGTTVLVAQSTWSTAITDSVSVTVIDNSHFTYFWEMDKTGETKNDNKKFNGDDGKTLTDGTVTLGKGENALDWDFHFDTPTKTVGGGQALTFGSTNDPYGNVEFRTTNTRKIRSISVLCSSSAAHIDDGSAHGTSGDEGTSRISITIGDTKYVDDVATPKYSTDQPLDTVTGGVFEDGNLTGDITIHFTPTYKDMETKVNAGAIYLKSIIIEYYRGNVTSIAVDEESTHNTQFFAGSKFSTDGLAVNAFYTESPETKVVVTHNAVVTTSNLDSHGDFISEAASQSVNISYTYRNITKTTSYNISVAKKLVAVKIEGTLTTSEYLVNEPLNYAGMSVALYSEGSEEATSTYSMEEYTGDDFTNIFDITNVAKTATKALNNGFIISIKHKITNLNGSYKFEASSVVVKDVSAIEVVYGNNETFAPTLREHSKYDYSNFKAIITYDNDTNETIEFPQLEKQKYTDPNNPKNKISRFDYTSYSPLTVLEMHETNGFEVKVVSTLSNVSGVLVIEPNQIKVVSITSIELILGPLTYPEYQEYDDMDYTGINLQVTFDTGEKEMSAYNDAKALTGYITEIDSKDVHKAVETPMFSFDAPKEARKEMENGFNISVTYCFNEEIAHTLAIPASSISVTEYIAKTYTRMDSFDDFAADGGNYIITSITPDNSSVMRIWDGSLDKDNIFNTPAKGGNYLTYKHDSVIGKTLTINYSKAEKAAFYITKNTDDNTLTVILASTKGDAKPLKLTINSGSASFVATSSSNAAKQRLLNLYDGNGNIQLGYNGGTYQKYVYYNKAANSDRFGVYNTGTNTVAIQIYKVGA